MYQESSYGNGFFSVLKSVGAALLVSFFSTIILAVLLNSTSLSQKIIYPINQTVKVLSILCGTLLFIRGEKGWLKGGGAGLLFTALSYLAFSAIGGDFSLSWLIFLEIAFAFVSGALGGIIAVNVKK